MDLPKQQSQVRIGLDNTTAIVCENCKNDTFVDVYYMRKISKLLTGAADDQLSTIPIPSCSKCGHINEQFKLKDQKLEKN